MDEKPMAGVDALRQKNALRTRNLEPGEATPRRRPVYPISAERELMRVNLAFANMAIKECRSFITATMRNYEEPETVRQDAAGDFISNIRGHKMAAAERLSKKTGAMRALEKEVSRVANLAETHSIRDWNDQVRDALGQGINADFYRDSMENMVDAWIHENVSKIGSIPAEYLNEVENIIRWGYETRQPKVNVYHRLEKLIGLTKSKAKAIARDQLGTLNAQMTQHEHESMGISKYKWITKRDSLVRDCHRTLHGKIFSWNEPPEMWYVTKSRGIVYTGRRCHPGEDYGCRCTASPVFDLEGAKELLARRFAPL